VERCCRRFKSIYFSNKIPLSGVAKCYWKLISQVETTCKPLNEGILYLVEFFKMISTTLMLMITVLH
jgi:hypothetical protein